MQLPFRPKCLAQVDVKAAPVGLSFASQVDAACWCLRGDLHPNVLERHVAFEYRIHHVMPLLACSLSALKRFLQGVESSPGVGSRSKG